jgi:hypothetical protein
MVSVLAIVPKVSGFKPGRGDGFSRAIKSIAHLSSEGSKAASPMSLDFTACKKSLLSITKDTSKVKSTISFASSS